MQNGAAARSSTFKGEVGREMGKSQSSTAGLPHPHPNPPLDGEGVAATYLKLIGTMFMWGVS